MTKEEWFDLPKLKMFDKDFKEKELDEEMTLGLLNELQVNWCGKHCDNYKKNSCGCYFPEFKEQMILKIKEHFESKENTLEFNSFKLHADGTLKNMLKDELISYIHMLHHNWDVSDEQLFNVIEKIKTLQNELDAIKNPQPYKFEDFKIGLWVYDIQPECKEFTFFKITKILSESDCESLYHDRKKKVFFDNITGHAREFEDGRFFPITKALEYQK